MLENTPGLDFSEIFRSNFLTKLTAVSITDCLITLAISFVIGLFIYFIYRKTFAGVIYSGTFSSSLIAMTMITALVCIGISSNAVLSLGMVGALSIVRFRSAIKDPIDIVFIFWAITEGILCGAGLVTLSLIGAPVIGLLLFLFSLRRDFSEPYLFVVRVQSEKAERDATEIVSEAVKSCRLKSKTMTDTTGTELIFDIRLKKGKSDFIQQISEVDGVTYSSLVSYDGNYSM
ncbi:MAG: DUF4956 domain-containing protein [Clostridia bacterium]|nr:DUF4956 domain-containing protein [Clostridia bacterium]